MIGAEFSDQESIQPPDFSTRW